MIGDLMAFYRSDDATLADARGRTKSSSSEEKLEAELHLARAVGLGGDFAEVGASVDVGVGAGESDSVQRVERLGAELQPDLLGDLELFEDREVDVVGVVVPQVGDERAQVTERVRSGLAEG